MESREAVAWGDQSAASREARRAERSPASPAAVKPPIADIPKCPYLAGRPPCGTHHLFPSGTNVCWADPGKAKPYRAISRETQRAHCFGGPDGPCGCDRYRRAVAEKRLLPQFEARRAGAPSRPAGAVPPRRREKAPRFLSQAAWLAPLCLTALLLLLLLR